MPTEAELEAKMHRTVAELKARFERASLFPETASRETDESVRFRGKMIALVLAMVAQDFFDCPSRVEEFCRGLILGAEAGIKVAYEVGGD
jgi:hypothetical protein